MREGGKKAANGMREERGVRTAREDIQAMAGVIWLGPETVQTLSFNEYNQED